jgi:hypothetical protein
MKWTGFWACVMYTRAGGAQRKLTAVVQDNGGSSFGLVRVYCGRADIGICSPGDLSLSGVSLCCRVSSLHRCVALRRGSRL